MLRLFCLLASLSATVYGACDTPFHQVGEGCYYFSIEYNLEMTWEEARQYCHSMGTDVDLAMMDLMCDDFRNLINYITIADPFTTFYVMWLGATGNGERYLWLDGRTLSVSSPYWASNQPQSSGCVTLTQHLHSATGTERFCLHVFTCSIDSYYFICQKYGDADTYAPVAR